MLTSKSRFSLICVFLAAAGTGSAQPAASASDSSQILNVQGGKIRVVTVADALYHPWSLAFADARTILVSERNGRLRMIRDGALLPEPVWTSPSAAGAGGDALHFVALHPKFSENQLVYVSYPKRDGDRITLAVARGRLSGSKLTDVQEIFVADAWETGGNLAGRIFSRRTECCM